MKTVQLNGAKAAGRVVLVDDEDYELVSQYRWYVFEKEERPGGRPTGPYAMAAPYRDGHKRPFFMHKLITGWPQTDHENHNGLDNRRSNLRPVTTAQNSHNKRPQLNSSSQYKGVTWHRGCRKWQAMINAAGRRRYLGVFTSEEDAARAFNDAALEAYGPYAYLNPVSPAGARADT